MMSSSINSNGERQSDNAQDTRQKKLKSNYGDTINVFVGTPPTKFAVHKDLISERSKYFVDVFEDNPEATQWGFPHKCENTFKLYLDWAYSASTDLPTAARLIDNIDGLEETVLLVRKKLCYRLCDLWCLADHLGDRTCKKTVIDTLLWEAAQTKIYVSAAICRYSYSQTHQGSNLRKWIVDAKFQGMNSYSVGAVWTSLPEDLVKDMMRALFDQRDAIGAVARLTEADAARYYD